MFRAVQLHDVLLLARKQFRLDLIQVYLKGRQSILGNVTGADERLWGLGVPPLPPLLPPPLPPLSPFWGVLVGVWFFWGSAACRLSLSLSRFFM